jgi:hypothetical protein
MANGFTEVEKKYKGPGQWGEASYYFNGKNYGTGEQGLGNANNALLRYKSAYSQHMDDKQAPAPNAGGGYATPGSVRGAEAATGTSTEQHIKNWVGALPDPAPAPPKTSAAPVDGRNQTQKEADFYKEVSRVTKAAAGGNPQPMRDFDKFFGFTRPEHQYGKVYNQDLSANGLTADTNAGIKNTLGSADTNNDGALSRAEMNSGFGNSDDVWNQFSAAERADGKITAAEFTGLVENRVNTNTHVQTASGGFDKGSLGTAVDNLVGAVGENRVFTSSEIESKLGTKLPAGITSDGKVSEQELYNYLNAEVIGGRGKITNGKFVANAPLKQLNTNGGGFVAEEASAPVASSNQSSVADEDTVEAPGSVIRPAGGGSAAESIESTESEGGSQSTTEEDPLASTQPAGPSAEEIEQEEQARSSALAVRRSADEKRIKKAMDQFAPWGGASASSGSGALAAPMITPASSASGAAGLPGSR